MNVLMISADPRILAPDSEPRARMRDYASVMDKLHIVVAGGAGEQIQEKNLMISGVRGGRIPRIFAAWRVTSSAARRAKFDVVTAQGADETGMVAWLVARRFGIPFQLQLHTDVFGPQYRRASWKEYARFLIARFLVPRAQCLRVVSERVRRSLGAKDAVVLPIWTDTAACAAAEKDPKTEERFLEYGFKMIAAGRLVDREKNFSMLIEMMRSVAAADAASLLVIVGDGPDRKLYEEKIRRYCLEKNVIMEPWRDDLPSFYKSFDLFLLPSNYEGWGRAAIEAMAAGLPVVMTDVGLAGEVVRDGASGIVVPVGDRAAFSDAVIRLMRDDAVLRRLADRGSHAAAALSPKTKEEYLMLYKRSFSACGV